MKRCAIAVSVTLALAGCAGKEGKLEIRQSPASSALSQKPAPERISEGHAQMALGNVALALELFRKAERDMPGNVQALIGMAICYEKMGRYDLASLKLETALARQPNNGNLLKLLAASFSLQGRGDEAEAARSQAKAIASAAGARSVTVQLPAARPADAPETVSAQAEPVSPPARSVKVMLPPVNGAASRAGADAPVSPEKQSLIRLERISPGETALVTSGRAPWSKLRSAEPRFKPFHRGAASVRLLNAARYEGLAAATRLSMQRRGWGTIAIGDAPKTRARSLVLYSTQNQPAARRLATQFGFALARAPRPGRVTVLLGRDAVHLMRVKST